MGIVQGQVGQGFEQSDHGNSLESLLGAYGVHLTEKGKSIFGHRLAKLVERALN